MFFNFTNNAAVPWCAVVSEEGRHEAIIFTLHRNLNLSVIINCKINNLIYILPYAIGNC